MYISFIDLVTCQFCVLPRPAYIVPSDIVNAVFDPVQAEKQILTPHGLPLVQLAPVALSAVPVPARYSLRPSARPGPG